MRALREHIVGYTCSRLHVLLDPDVQSACSTPQLGVAFVGRVVEVWPTREVLEAQQHTPRPQLRRLILQRWRGVLSAGEEELIRTSPEWGRIQFTYEYMQRVRFAVIESFAGPPVQEIYTDVSSCGYQFEPGESYLVDSYREGPRFRTGACSRTAKVDSVVRWKT